ncbi:MAG TPA: tRNA (adenosine(37)-N6)-threonylcarbamoyltransferase complex ATPase subunit type 1 TsaE [Parafilimonas sp.]|nr:tRNA (adenosine(37)-N6)-threonylcarbamoyltransferase complex ATPase subunit type 1 TsaE [Parafilimonas sp.]
METRYHIKQIKQIATQLWEEGRDKKIWAFHADMGGGKTTLIHALCDLLRVDDAVGSPTFAIINEYKSAVAGIIFHMDWYRIKDETEAVQAGCEDCIDSGNFCFIEWPEKAPLLLPADTFNVFLSVINEHERRLTTA